MRHLRDQEGRGMLRATLLTAPVGQSGPRGWEAAVDQPAGGAPRTVSGTRCVCPH